MKYVFLDYTLSPEFYTAEGWFKKIACYAGIMERLAEGNTVIYVKQTSGAGTGVYKGINYQFIDSGSNQLRSAWRLNRYVVKLKPDIIVVQGLHNSFSLLPLGFLMKKRAKIIAHHHAEKPFAGVKKYVQRMAGHFIDAYLFASGSIGLEWVHLGNIGSPKKIVEVMEVSSVFYPLDREVCRQKTGVTGQPIFLWVGRLNENKDPLNVVSAFLRYLEYKPSAKLYMLFHTDELLQPLTQLLAVSGYGASVALVGQLPHRDLLYWFNSADFFLSGSHYEGSGTALCEAMSCGCIPVVTDIPSFRMMTDNGRCGVLYPPANEEALLAVLLQADNVDMEMYRQRVLSFFQANLSFEGISGRIANIAESL
jgi:glycosyltransferase involved in cell wall biosynthesis